MRQHTQWRWRLDEVYVRVQGEMRYLWRAVDHEGEVLESFVTKQRDKAAAVKFMKKADEAARLRQGRHHRWPALVRRGREGAQHRRSTGGRPLGQQQGRELPPAVPTTGAGDAAVQANEDAGHCQGKRTVRSLSSCYVVPPHKRDARRPRLSLVFLKIAACCPKTRSAAGRSLTRAVSPGPPRAQPTVSRGGQRWPGQSGKCHCDGDEQAAAF